ncbi:hypothetical protein [Pandoraea sp. ISTKB]|uniref:hypothetical protein n=1 Tax=Pandoraea sp. ISTKB TaxID=1586708 RepID=UPI001112F997|nr:hypothetical protein [Pandoraea sp. ISTKB]
MFRYSMTLRSGNPQALMLPSQCLHHYHVDPHPDAAEAHDSATRTGALTRAGQWLRSFVRGHGQARRD